MLNIGRQYNPNDNVDNGLTGFQMVYLNSATL